MICVGGCGEMTGGREKLARPDCGWEGVCCTLGGVIG